MTTFFSKTHSLPKYRTLTLFIGRNTFISVTNKQINMQTNNQTPTPTYSSPAVVWLAPYTLTHISSSITCKTGKDSSFSTRQRELIFSHVEGHDLMYSLYHHYCYCCLISLSVKKEFLRADSILISDGQDTNISHSFRVYTFFESRIVFQILRTFVSYFHSERYMHRCYGLLVIVAWSKNTENVGTIAVLILYIYCNIISQQVMLCWEVYWVRNVRIWISLRQCFSTPHFRDSAMLFLLNVGGENYDLEIVYNNIMFIPNSIKIGQNLINWKEWHLLSLKGESRIYGLNFWKL